jgi:hypothetical protein
MEAVAALFYMKKWPNVLISLALFGWNASLGSIWCGALMNQVRGPLHRGSDGQRWT